MNASSNLSQLIAAQATRYNHQNLAFAMGSSGHSISGMAWAVPVAVDKVGAHLQAYAEYEPAIFTLRALQGFGKGIWAIVPREVLGMIEEYVKAPVIAKHERKWKKDRNCVEWECKDVDHFSYDRIVDVQKHLSEGCACACGCGQLSNEGPVMQYFNSSEERWSLHQSCIQRFMTRVDSMPAIHHGPHAQPEGAFAKLNRLMGRDFGLEVFITDFDMTNANYGLKHSVPSAYIILGSSVPLERGGAVFHSNHLNHTATGSSFTSTYAIPRQALTELPEDQLLRFKYALKVLMLKPYVHPLSVRQQVPSNLAGPGPNDTRKQRIRRALELENWSPPVNRWNLSRSVTYAHRRLA